LEATDRNKLSRWNSLDALFFCFVLWGGVEPSSLLLGPVPAPDDDECGAVGGVRIGRGNRSTRRKPAPVQLCLPQIPLDLTRLSNPGHRGGKPATSRG
jgi:hypothetical protein